MTEVTKVQGLSVQDQFAPFEKKAQEWAEKAKSIKVTDASQKELINAAREARLALRQTRLDVVALHKDLKEDSLRTGQFLDSVKRKLVGLIEPIETHLQEQEDFEKVQEDLRKKNLQIERRKIMADLIGSEADYMQLGEMSQDVFDGMVAGYKENKRVREEQAEKDRLQKIEDDRKREEEDKRVREENERLRKQNDEAHAKLKREQEERLKLEREADKKFKQEEEIRKEREKNERKMKRAPDRVKLLSLAEHIELLPAPEGLKDEQAKAILANAQKLLSKVVKYITENAESL